MATVVGKGAAPCHIPKFKSLNGSFSPTFLPNGWAVAIMDIDPELATEMIQRNVTNQRSFNSSTGAKYMEAMRSGGWLLTHQGVAFDADGHLEDGQHRLSAVIASGVTIRSLVFFGVGGEREMAVLDTGRLRNILDATKVLGIDITKNEITMWSNAIRFGVPNGHSLVNRISNSSRIELMRRNLDRIRLIGGWIGGTTVATKICVAAVRGALLCASYYVDHETLGRFVRVLTEQDNPQEGETAAKVLRQFVQTHFASAMLGSETFSKTCRAIELFIENKDIIKGLYICPVNPFPLPEAAYILEASTE